jgi:hypothetical protein
LLLAMRRKRLTESLLDSAFSQINSALLAKFFVEAKGTG